MPKKLGIKPRARLAVVDGPDGFLKTLGELPAGVVRQPLSAGDLDTVVFFSTQRQALAGRFVDVARHLAPDGSLWVAWPKRASRVPTDLSENVIRDIGLVHGMVDTKVCAIDKVWSGLRFVVRLENRAGWPSSLQNRRA